MLGAAILYLGGGRGERTARDEPDTEMGPDCESAALELGCRWDSWWKRGHRRSNGLRDLMYNPTEELLAGERG